RPSYRSRWMLARMVCRRRGDGDGRGGLDRAAQRAIRILIATRQSGARRHLVTPEQVPAHPLALGAQGLTCTLPPIIGIMIWLVTVWQSTPGAGATTATMLMRSAGSWAPSPLSSTRKIDLPPSNAGFVCLR